MKFETVRIHFFQLRFRFVVRNVSIMQRDVKTSLYSTHRNSPKFGAGTTLLNLLSNKDQRNSLTLPQGDPVDSIFFLLYLRVELDIFTG